MTPRQRREKGTGSISQRSSDGMWVVRIELPSADGKRRRKAVARAKKSEAVAVLRELRKELERSGDLATSSPTLGTWMALWLDRIAAPKLKPRTLSTYRGYVDRYIVPTIGRVQLDKVTVQHVRRVHDTITEQGLSSTTALQAHRILAKALTDAMREGRITRNPATLLDAPRKAVSRREALTADEARTLLLSVAHNDTQAAAWSVALLTGLRQGERLGLTRDAIDFDTGTITVSWQLQRFKWQHGCKRDGEQWSCGRTRAGWCPQRRVPIPAGQEATQVGGLWLARPKSRSGWREVPMAPMLATILERYMAAHPPGMAGLIFTRDDGRPIDPRDDTAAWDAALKAAGLPDVVLHSARHTTATLLHALGVDERVRVMILGHSSATTTAGYTHVADAMAREAMTRLGEHLGPRTIEGA